MLCIALETWIEQSSEKFVLSDSFFVTIQEHGLFCSCFMIQVLYRVLGDEASAKTRHS